MKKILKALEFYADPDTYFAIGLFPDNPCGEFIKDISETELGKKPGALARKALLEYYSQKYFHNLL